MVKELGKSTDITGTYRHFKGNNYEVLGEAVEENGNERYVFYRQLYDPFSFWIKPKPMFFEKKKVGDIFIDRYNKIAEGQKDILTKVNLSEIIVRHTETEDEYRISKVDRGIFIIRKMEH